MKLLANKKSITLLQRRYISHKMKNYMNDIYMFFSLMNIIKK